jgi:dipeptidyl aminopeptidase/acylaminoacyl peptidase
MYVHGGPFTVRDNWGFQNYVQLFTNRGYAVMQVKADFSLLY